MALLLPNLYYRHVTDIDLDALRAGGIETLLLDIDNTVLPRDGSPIPTEIVGWVQGLSSNGFGVCLVSNNWHEHVKRIADSLGILMVPRALKPLPFGFYKAAKLMGAPWSRTAVVGDQIFTDILGGNLLGMTTVLVQPLSASDLPHTLALRRIEHRLLAGRAPLP